MRSDDSVDTTIAQRGRGGTQDGSARQSSRAAGLGQAQAAQPAERGGTGDRTGRNYVRGVGRPRSDRAPGANQPKTGNAHEF